MKKGQWLIGCSGFAYKEWKDVFYPPKLAQKNWFSFYAQHFNTLELNVTFYRFPTLQSLKGWHAKAPDGFAFSAKVPRSITHFAKLAGAETMLEDFYGLLEEGLGDKVGCVLFQLPPQFAYTDERLEKVLQAVKPGFTNVVEFRHESWWRPDVEKALKDANISFCGVSFPKISNDDAVINTSVCYYRFHGVPKLFYSEYDEAFLDKIVAQIKGAEGLEKAYLYFNNTASSAALKNARYVKSLIENKHEH